MTLQIQRVTDASQITEATRRAWNALPIPSPMQSADWLLGWWDAYGRAVDGELCVLLMYDRERLVGVAPWYLQKQWTGGNCIRFLGDGEVCSDHSTLLVAEGHGSRVVCLLADELASGRQTEWHAMHLQSINQCDTTIGQLIDRLSAAGISHHARAVSGSWVVDLASDWEDFLSGLSRNHRKRCRRWQRDFFENQRARVAICRPADFPACWRELVRLNEQRREVLGDRSAFADERFLQFHQAVAPGLIASGRAQLRELHVDGQLRAIEYVLLQGKTVYCYQSGMETSSDRVGYGNLSLLGLFRDAVSAGYERIDFLRGDEDYKQHWAARPVAVADHHLASRSLLGSAHVALHQSLDAVRSLRDCVLRRVAI